MKALSKHLYGITLILFALGLVLGFTVPGMFAPIAFIGDCYVKLLKLIVIPLLMTQIAGSVYRASGKLTGRLLRTVGLFVLMFVVSYCITAVLVGIIGPGRGIDLGGEAYDGTLAAATIGDFFRSVVPDNILSAMSTNSILPCILFAFVTGLAAQKVGAESAMRVIDDFARIFVKLMDWLMFISPVGVFSLIGSAAANYGSILFGVGAKYILLAWGLCAVVTVLVMILPVWILAKVSPITYIKRVCRVWLVTLSTCSSAATLPHTVRVCNEEFGVPEEITGIVVPLGCTIHMCGGAVSFCLLGMFTMQMAGIPMTAGLFLQMLLIATLMNMAAPGIPGGGIVLGATYLGILGAPTTFIGLYSGIYRLLDMAYTTLNVTGDVTANVLIWKRESAKR